ncbi:D-alanyl-D-alanine carboxypeptidase/D-alanyl-D-alanine-endopeptidase [Pseudooceanicola sp. CBS1P-1]|uniref:D-alanyl-D-alanine carboxypeptidase/D-alanyl-D-alanine-endopeptidase n=2 Tax=Paracoccaceae TaxID=31989 RepID=A0A6L7G4F0_9RHOB|nr:D-alanyl-D-alanine carboxypeptidase/D-alanyl-D-alanine-endopeptidase [Pseudooceanicola endophyticus]MXN18230.1 D-alanyl-D-alanine carboxypeptidase/D-alanyl-D-alanine-endopeptidase [Pseudooceanicola albus]
MAASALPAYAAGIPEALRPKKRPSGLSAQPAAATASEVTSSGLTHAVESVNVPGDSACIVHNLTTGETLESYHGDHPMAPASVAKTMTSMYALEHLGADHRFQTRLLTTGLIDNGVLKGDLILAGGGDPVLDTQDLGELAAQLRAVGIHSVEGAFQYYGKALPETRNIDPGQPYHVSYNPGISGLNLNFNRVYFDWKKVGGKFQISMQAPAGRYRPGVEIATMEIVDQSESVFTWEDRDGKDVWTVLRSALNDDGARWLPVTRPAAYTAEVFATLARSNGIVLGTPEALDALPGDAYQIAQHESQTLDAILKDMLFYSTNVTAEIVGVSTTIKLTGQIPPTLDVSARYLSAWARQRFGMKEVDMVDHSGLGDASRVSVRDLATMLNSKSAQVQLHPLLKVIPLRKGGKSVDPHHPYKVEAKTGTLNFVSALAGYETAPNGHKLVFAIISNNLPKRDELTRNQKEHPPGGAQWLGRARYLQQNLMERWGGMYKP